jgi:glycosyltransferase involved in cell wall biosynthesis
MKAGSNNSNGPTEPVSAGLGRLIVAIPTTGRSKIASQTIREMVLQSRLPDLLVVVIATPSDIDEAEISNLPFALQILQSKRGTCSQRNAALKQMQPDDIILFIDDDFLLAPDYLLQVEKLFRDEPDIVMATGDVLVDGIVGPGLSYDEGAPLLKAHTVSTANSEVKTIYNCYGCNMALRARPAIENEIRFDELLPLYGWLEDVDFSRRLARHGRIVKAYAMRGVHLGTKTGRGSGLKLGYSQVCNPLYLRSKGTMIASRAFSLMARNVASNLVRSIRPEHWVDRRGRLRGNILAFFDLMRGKMRPDRVEDLK